MTMTPTDPKALRALALEATQGPWKAVTAKGIAAVKAPPCYVYYNEQGELHSSTVVRWHADARYIAAVSPPVVLALIDRAEAAEREVEWLRRIEEAAKELDAWASDVVPTRLWDRLSAALKGGE